MASDRQPHQNENTQAAGAAAAVLPTFYYLDNFKALMQSVYVRYDDILSEQESHYYHQLMACETEALALYVRLLMRKGNYFRYQKLHYAELQNPEKALRQLCEKQLLRQPEVGLVDDLFPLYTRAEWLRFLNGHGSKSEPGMAAARSRLKKHELLVELVDKTGETLSCEHAFGETLIEVLGAEHFTIYRRLYFGNDSQNLAEFVLRDLGLFRYEKFRLDKATRLFETRAQIDALQVYYELREHFDTIDQTSLEALDEVSAQLPLEQIQHTASSLAERALSRRLQKLLNQVARQYERLEHFEQALALFAHSRLAPATERRIRILDKLKRFAEAENLCQQLSASGTEAEKIFAGEFKSKLDRKRNKKNGKNGNPVKRFKSESECKGLHFQEGQSVEQHVAQSFQGHGECFYVENHLFLGVLGLLYWPAIFADVPGAFSHPFQSAPHDLYQDDFFLEREEYFDHAAKKLVDWVNRPILALEQYQKCKGVANVFVHWQVLSPELLQLALQRIPVSDWECIFQRLWQDLRENRSGFPDLVFFPDTGGYELLEVKGPGDRLQANQQRWLRFFAEHSIPSRVIYVNWLQVD